MYPICHGYTMLVGKELNLDQIETQYYLKPFGNTTVTGTILLTLCFEDISAKIIINVTNIVVVIRTFLLDIFYNNFIDESTLLQLKYDVPKAIMQIDQL